MKYLISYIPMILALFITLFIFIPISARLNLAKKISKHIPTESKFKPLFFSVIIVIILLIIGLLDLYIIPMSNFTYYILTGIIAGIGISITVELSPKHHN